MKNLRYRCLVLDHDDTVVDSTATIHYPAFIETMKLLRPDVHMSLPEYFCMNCVPGLFSYHKDVLKLTPEELSFKTEYWLGYVAAHTPSAYEGIEKIISSQKAGGGYVCVVSHSRKQNIERDYSANKLQMPDLIYGSDLPPEQQKPSAYPVLDIARRLNLNLSDILIVDDLPLGYEMAANAHVDFAAACWAHDIPFVKKFMLENNANCFLSPGNLYDYLF